MALDGAIKVAAFGLGERAAMMGGDGAGIAQAILQLAHQYMGTSDSPTAAEMDRVAAGHRPNSDFEIGGIKIPRFLFQEEAPVAPGERHEGLPKLKTGVKYGGIALATWFLLKGGSQRGFSQPSYSMFDGAWNLAWLLGMAPYNKGGAIPQLYAEGLIPNWGHMMPALENPQASPFGFVSRLLGV